MTPRAGLSPARRLGLGLVVAALVAAVAAAVGWRVALETALDEAAEAGRTQLAFAASRFDGDLARYKLLVKTLAGAKGPETAAPQLERAAAMSGAERIVFMPLGATPDAAAQSAVSRARHGAIGLAYDAAEAAFLIAAPAWRNGAVTGTIMAVVDAETLEWSWRALPEVLFFTGVGGRIQATSLASLRGRAAHSADGALPEIGVGDRMGHVVWRLDDPEWRALGVYMTEAMVLALPQPGVEMTAFMLLDTSPARGLALTFAVALGAGVFALCLLALVVLQRRAAFRQRLAIEARATAVLEDKVAARTQELTAEVAERRQAETALRAAQDELVQAGKMSALGHMAAGLAHELNQPLTAMRGFADNAAILLERGREEEAAGNLARISALTARTARIIKNLRAFARNEPEPAAAVPLAPVVEDALALAESRIREAGAVIRVDLPDQPVVVVGGAVRLQQVLLNLIANALDAQGETPVIEIGLITEAGRVRLTVRDHGPGVPDELLGRIFDPFFSTKSASSEGMGLGLSISYRIIQEFGGDLTVANHPEGGAAFTVDLALAEPAAEALAS